MVLENSASTESGVMICFVCYRGKRKMPTIPQETPKRQKHDGFTEDMLDPFPPSEESPATSPSLLDNNNNNTDDDLFIVENTTTPVSGKPGVELIKVKVESDQSNIDMQPECGGSVIHDDSTLRHLVATVSRDLETTSNIGAVTVGTTTQTEIFRVKEEPQSQNGGRTSQTQVDHFGNGFCLRKQPTEQETNNEDLETQMIQKVDANGSTRRSSPQLFLHVTEPQEEQHQLQVALQAAAQERDSLKEQVQVLTVQLQEAQYTLKELTESTVKKENSQQLIQTEDGNNYKHLFRKLKQKISELIKDNTFLLPTVQAQPSVVQGEEKEFCDIVQPVEFLIQELKQRNKERDELCSQVSQTNNSYL